MENKEHAKKNYDLKSQAVEDLLNADSEQVPEYSEEELKKYRSRVGIRIPSLLKVLFIKAWFAGAVCYFILWGLGMYLPGQLDKLFVLAMAMGLVTDLLVNNVLRFIEKIPGENEDWILVTRKGMVGLGLNLLYGAVVIFCVYSLYNLINLAVISITGKSDTIPLGVEPILFGVFCLGIDLMFIGIKRLLMNVITDAKNAAREST